MAVTKKTRAAEVISDHAVLSGPVDGTPLLRWAGSKKKLLPMLQQAAPPRMRRYIEPFAGSAVLFLRLQPRRAILSDINADLIATYQAVRDKPSAVWRLASRYPTTEPDYYRVRAMDPAVMKPLERAARFVYLNRFCFNGVYRTNGLGQFNVARGKGHLGIPSRELFNAFAERLASVDLRCTDFESTVRRAGRDDFVYLDPPYAGTGTRDRGEYGPGSFKSLDLERLAACLDKASSKGARVLLSYADQPDLLKLLGHWHVRRLSVTRNVSGFTGARGRAKEVLISNYLW
jgi:DNA adenine methylase